MLMVVYSQHQCTYHRESKIKVNPLTDGAGLGWGGRGHGGGVKQLSNLLQAINLAGAKFFFVYLNIGILYFSVFVLYFCIFVFFVFEGCVSVYDVSQNTDTPLLGYVFV